MHIRSFILTICLTIIVLLISYQARFHYTHKKQDDNKKVNLIKQINAKLPGKNNINKNNLPLIAEQNKKNEIKSEQIRKSLRDLVDKIIKKIDEDGANAIYCETALTEEIKQIRREFLEQNYEDAKLSVEEIFKICRERESLHEPVCMILLNILQRDVLKHAPQLRPDYFKYLIEFAEERNREIDKIFGKGTNYAFNFLNDNSQSFGRRCDVLYRLFFSEYLYDQKNLDTIIQFLSTTETPAFKSYSYYWLADFAIKASYKPEFGWEGRKGATKEGYLFAINSFISHLISSYDWNAKYTGVRYAIFSSLWSFLRDKEYTNNTVQEQIVKKYQYSVEELAIRELFNQFNSGKVDEQILNEVQNIMILRGHKNSKNWADQMKIILYSNCNPELKKTALAIICPRDLINIDSNSRQEILNILMDLILREQDKSVCIAIFNHLMTEFSITQNSDTFKFIIQRRADLINPINDSIKSQAEWKGWPVE